mmetsp:Transcript_16654/g.45328  ORF Transcript_16654/g.45328 Transcript_16654/m.45328 type:complete len:261 (+) Transcript_16654:99-881(+)
MYSSSLHVLNERHLVAVWRGGGTAKSRRGVGCGRDAGGMVDCCPRRQEDHVVNRRFREGVAFAPLLQLSDRRHARFFRGIALARAPEKEVAAHDDHAHEGEGHGVGPPIVEREDDGDGEDAAHDLERHAKLEVVGEAVAARLVDHEVALVAVGRAEVGRAGEHEGEEDRVEVHLGLRSHLPRDGEEDGDGGVVGHGGVEKRDDEVGARDKPHLVAVGRVDDPRGDHLGSSRDCQRLRQPEAHRNHDEQVDLRPVPVTASA